MEFFNKAQAVRLRSHLDKYLLAEEENPTVRQSRNEKSQRVIWTVEPVAGNTHLLRLKSSSGKYLKATEEPFLLGTTGKKVLQSTTTDSLVEWEPIREGFQVKLRSRTGTFLRANGAMKPWRNTLTHDIPHKSATHNWILWDVIKVDLSELDQISNQNYASFESQLTRFSSTVSESFMDSPRSTWSSPNGSPNKLSTQVTRFSSTSFMDSPRSPLIVGPHSTDSPKWSTQQLGMEFFQHAKSVRLKSHLNKYLVAEDDEEKVTQERNGSQKAARWTVEFIPGGSYIRLKSCYGKYLTASNSPFLLGATGRKVLQTLPNRLDSSLEWEPVKDGHQHIKLKTRYGNFLRGNGGVYPYRNSVTHDVPVRTATQDSVLWEVDVMEIQVHADSPKPKVKEEKEKEEEEPDFVPPYEPFSPPRKEPYAYHPGSRQSSKLEPSGSFLHSKTMEGRIIFYRIADENGEVDEGVEAESFTFKGKGVDELKKKLEEETGLEGITVCTRSVLDGELKSLRLNLPPNNASMNVIVVPST